MVVERSLKYLISSVTIFLFSSSVLGAFPFNECRMYGDYLKGKFEDIESASKRRDVSHEIESLRKTARHFCKQELSDELEKSFIPLKKRGLENHLELMESEAKRVSEFRAPIWERDEIERVRKELGVESPIASKELNRLISLGRANSISKKFECTEIDNRKPPLVEVRNGKIIDRPRNQDSIGWCYAFAAADLISHKLGKKVSAIDIANNYNNGSFKDVFGFNETSMEGGFTSSAANEALEKGLCLESQLPSDDYSFSTDSNLMKEYQRMEKLYESFRNRTTEPGLVFGRNQLKGLQYSNAVESFERDLECNRLEGEFNVLFPTLSVGDFVKVLEQSSSANDLIDNLVAKSCKKRIANNLNLKFEEDSLLTSSSTMVETINKKLEGGDIIGVNYKASTLSNLLDHDNDSRHASIIVARKFNEQTGSCEYLIRNSWGNTRASSYDSRTRSGGGNHWMPEEYLRESMHGVSYVK